MNKLDMLQLGKVALVGVFGSLVMFLFMVVGIHVTGVAPFQLPPSAAFLEQMGLNIGPLPLLVHFGYGATWSVVLVMLFQRRTNLARGLALAMGLWLFMMVVYSPLIGWGFFGFGGSEFPKDSILFLESGPKYLIVTFLLHVVYGSIIGWLNSVWISFKQSASSQERQPAIEQE